MNPFHSPTASRAELASYYALLALQIPVHRIGDHTGGMAVKLDGTREPRHTRLDRDLRGERYPAGKVEKRHTQRRRDLGAKARSMARGLWSTAALSQSLKDAFDDPELASHER